MRRGMLHRRVVQGTVADVDDPHHVTPPRLGGGQGSGSGAWSRQLQAPLVPWPLSPVGLDGSFAALRTTYQFRMTYRFQADDISFQDDILLDGSTEMPANSLAS